VLTTYFDASGTRHDSDIVTLAGFVSDDEQWDKFEEEWNAVLNLFSVPYLHMREFAHFKGPYKTWREDEAKRRTFLDRLAGVMARRTRLGVCRSIRVQDFEALDREFALRDLIGSPLAFAGLACIGAVELWHRKYGEAEPRGFIFKDGDSEKQTLTKALQHFHGMKAVYKPKQEHVQFQAADWAAYENRNLSSDWMRRSEQFTLRDYRRSAMIIYDRMATDWGDMGDPEMRTICEQLAIPKR